MAAEAVGAFSRSIPAAANLLLFTNSMAKMEPFLPAESSRMVTETSTELPLDPSSNSTPPVMKPYCISSSEAPAESILKEACYSTRIPAVSTGLQTLAVIYSATPMAGCGTVYKLEPSGLFTVLHAFAGNPSEFPFAGVVMDPSGNLYGTTTGLPNCCGSEGSVFRLAP
jgi:hypothetical protein